MNSRPGTQNLLDVGEFADRAFQRATPANRQHVIACLEYIRQHPEPHLESKGQHFITARIKQPVVVFAFTDNKCTIEYYLTPLDLASSYHIEVVALKIS